MLTDIEIAQSAKLKPISEIAKSVGIDEDYLIPYGKYKAKIDLEFMKRSRIKGRQTYSRHRHKPHPRRRGQDNRHSKPRTSHAVYRQECRHSPS